MVIDFHTHTFPSKISKKSIEILEEKGKLKANTDGTIDGLVESMGNTIDISVTLPVATNTHQVEVINNLAISILNDPVYNKKIVPFGGIHPDYINYKEELKKLKESNILGIKIHPDYQETYIDDDRFVSIINEAFKNDLIVITHSGIDIGIDDDVKATPTRILNLISKLEYKGTLILAHMGGWKMWEDVYDKIDAIDNLYFDLSFSLGELVSEKKLSLMDEEMFYKFIKKYSSKKILFGSDSPWGNQTKQLEYVKKLELTKDELEDILYRNALRVLKK